MQKKRIPRIIVRLQANTCHKPTRFEQIDVRLVRWLVTLTLYRMRFALGSLHN